MLSKIMSKLRKALAPSSKKEAAKPQSSGKFTSKKPQHRQGNKPQRGPASGGNRGQSQPKGQGQSQGQSQGQGQGGRHGGRGRSDDARRGDRQHGSSRLQRGSQKPAREAVYEPPLRKGPPKQIAPVPPQDTAFSKLGLSDHIAYAVAQKGYSDPTPIQAQAIPLVLAGRDVTGSAQTGTGKTAAFALPILQRLGSHGRLRCLVLEPTRELAIQVEEAFRKYSEFTDLDATIVYGGVGYGKQRDDLARGVDILVATPGRLLDHMEQGTVRLDSVEILVLDEVDRMLDMGFLPDVRRIVQKCAKERQTLFFTATLPPEIAQLAAWALRDPVEVKIGANRTPAETVSHAFYPVVASQKPELLDELIKRTDYHSIIIFSRTKYGADRIARRISREGRQVGVLHSDRNQRERQEALAGFKSGKYEILVATDIAARGLDIADVSHVINYDVPENPEDYVHRIGRTGRAQKTGDAFTLVTEDDVRDARSIERFINASIERKKLDGFNYIYSALFDESAQADVSPKPASRLHRGGRR